MRKERVVQRFKTGQYTYTLKEIVCGKPTCRKCPHGPYWYLSFQKNGKKIYKYLGKKLRLVGEGKQIDDEVRRIRLLNHETPGQVERMVDHETPDARN